MLLMIEGRVSSSMLDYCSVYKMSRRRDELKAYFPVNGLSKMESDRCRTLVWLNRGKSADDPDMLVEMA